MPIRFSVSDPDNPHNVPIYEGESPETALVAGDYPATVTYSNGDERTGTLQITEPHMGHVALAFEPGA